MSLLVPPFDPDPSLAGHPNSFSFHMTDTLLPTTWSTGSEADTSCYKTTSKVNPVHHFNDVEAAAHSTSFSRLIQGLTTEFERLTLANKQLEVECVHLRHATIADRIAEQRDLQLSAPNLLFRYLPPPHTKRETSIHAIKSSPVASRIDEENEQHLPVLLGRDIDSNYVLNLPVNPTHVETLTGRSSLDFSMERAVVFPESTAASSADHDTQVDISFDIEQAAASASEAFNPREDRTCIVTLSTEPLAENVVADMNPRHHSRKSSDTEMSRMCSDTEMQAGARVMKGSVSNSAKNRNSFRDRILLPQIKRMTVLSKDNRSPARRFVGDIVAHSSFDKCIGLVILCDGSLLGLEAQHEMSPMLSDDLINAMEWCSLTIRLIFFLELMLRFFGFGIKTCLENSWTRFDAVLVLFAILETICKYSADTEMGPITILRVFRLARLARAARLMIQFRTLWLLVSGLRASFMTVMWTFLLIAFIGYIFAVLGMETIPLRNEHGSAQRLPLEGDLTNVSAIEMEYQSLSLAHFGSIFGAMLTLLQVLTLDSISAIYRPLVMDAPGRHGLFNIVYFLLFIFFVSISLMNLVTAVMVEGALQQANADKESQRAHDEQRKKSLMPKLREMFMQLDEDGSGEVTIEEIVNAPSWLSDELKAITHTEDLTEIFSLLDDDDSGYVRIDEFLEGIYKASKGDVMAKLQLARLVKQCGQMKAAICPPNSERPVVVADTVAPPAKAVDTLSSQSRQLAGTIIP